ncbi:MAG: Ubiquinone biosynthesis protein [Geoglossum umbratile]|nr:MAG: Ubiquinone biosynthesis protein [Geoglossum umbratile]
MATILRPVSCLKCPQPARQLWPRAASLSLGSRRFSVLSRPPPNYEGHVPLTVVERAALAAGSALMSLLNPRRADLIAALGEATATPYFIYRLRDVMLSDPTGRRILRDRPRITSATLSLERLRAFPPGSVGYEYARWLDREGVSPDTRDVVKYIDDEECAYIMQRYRECHDFYHALTGLPVMVEGEIALKAFEFANTLLPMTGLSMFAVIRLKPDERGRFWSTYLPWALENGLRAKEVINVYWEEELGRDVEDLRSELGIEKPVDLRATRKMIRARRKAERERTS